MFWEHQQSEKLGGGELESLRVDSSAQLHRPLALFQPVEKQRLGATDHLAVNRAEIHQLTIREGLANCLEDDLRALRCHPRVEPHRVDPAGGKPAFGELEEFQRVELAGGEIQRTGYGTDDRVVAPIGRCQKAEAILEDQLEFGLLQEI